MVNIKNLKLVKAKKEDLDNLAKIYAEEFSKPPYNEAWTIEKSIKKIKFFDKFNDLYAIEVNKEIVGFIVINSNFMCPGEVAFGEEIAIRSDFQNKGIGTWVFGEIFRIYKEKGFKRFLGIADVDSKAYNLYKKIGMLPSKKDLLIEKRLN